MLFVPPKRAQFTAAGLGNENAAWDATIVIAAIKVIFMFVLLDDALRTIIISHKVP
jgi:hypothetical protein